MDTIEKLIEESVLELEKNSTDTIIVGNRPHYPMLLLFNNAFTPNDCEYVFGRMSRIWSQSSKHLIGLSYSLQESSVEICDCYNNSTLLQDDILSRIDESKKANDMFASMREWCVYNIIDTSNIESVDDFVIQYEFYKKIRDYILDPYKIMVIVLLDDSTRHRNIATSIKKYIAEETNPCNYDSTIIISNRSRDNSMCGIDELYRITANILVLSNNDAVSNVDDLDYKSRVSILYSGTPYIISYVLRERPNKKIATQIFDVIFNKLQAAMNDQKPIEQSQWIRRLHFENATSLECENFLKKINFEFDIEILRHLPFRDISGIAKLNISQMRFRDFKSTIFEDSFSDFVTQFCNDQIIKGIEVDACIEAFEKRISDEFDSIELSMLTDETINEIFEYLNTPHVSEDMEVKDYFIRFVKVILKKTLIYPKFKEVLVNKRNISLEKLSKIKNSHSSFKSCMPLSFEDIGVIYKTRTTNFFNSAHGTTMLKYIFNPDLNTFEQLLFCFKEIIKANPDLFKLSFINAWALQLGLAGDQIYRMIGRAITEDADKTIKLYGNYPIDERLKILMLHTYDANGENPTELYEYLRETFKNDSIVQYFNTGFDDALEAIYFITCSGNNLLY